MRPQPQPPNPPHSPPHTPAAHPRPPSPPNTYTNTRPPNQSNHITRAAGGLSGRGHPAHRRRLHAPDGRQPQRQALRAAQAGLCHGEREGEGKKGGGMLGMWFLLYCIVFCFVLFCFVLFYLEVMDGLCRGERRKGRGLERRGEWCDGVDRICKLDDVLIPQTPPGVETHTKTQTQQTNNNHTDKLIPYLKKKKKKKKRAPRGAIARSSCRTCRAAGATPSSRPTWASRSWRCRCEQMLFCYVCVCDLYIYMRVCVRVCVQF
jgi:hypothetical protein